MAAELSFQLFRNSADRVVRFRTYTSIEKERYNRWTAQRSVEKADTESMFRQDGARQPRNLESTKKLHLSAPIGFAKTVTGPVRSEQDTLE